MRRREFFTLVGGASALPLTAIHAQQSAMPTVGVLWPGAEPPAPPRMESFRQVLRQLGFIEGQNLAIELRYARNGLQQLPELAAELKLITTEVRAGKPRIEAFKNFAARTRVDDVRALVAMLVQTDRFGTSIAQALRTHAEVSRTKRRQRAEEKAAKVGVKLVFPLVFFLFPAFYVVTLGPAVIQFVRVFFGQVVR